MIDVILLRTTAQRLAGLVCILLSMMAGTAVAHDAIILVRSGTPGDCTPLQGALCTLTWTNSESGYRHRDQQLTDRLGACRFDNLVNGVRYGFELTNSGYETETFELTPTRRHPEMIIYSVYLQVKFDNVWILNWDRPRRQPEGKIVYHRESADHEWQLFTAKDDGSGESCLTVDSAGRDPRWSPDGRSIAYIDPSYNQLSILEADGTGTRTLDLGDIRLFWGSVTVTWSPDGQKLVFSGELNNQVDLWVVDVDSGHLEQLTDTPLSETDPDYSPDGAKIVYTRRDNFHLDLFDADVFVMNSDGTNPIQLTHAAEQDQSPRWSPRGDKIVFVSRRDGNWEIYLMNADGSHEIRLTSNTFIDLSPCWSADGRSIMWRRGLNLWRMNLQDGESRLIKTDVGWSLDWYGTRLSSYWPRR